MSGSISLPSSDSLGADDKLDVTKCCLTENVSRSPTDSVVRNVS